MGLTSKVAKNLYESNAALKTKHEALLARLPTAPISASPTTPDSPDRVISRNRSFSELDSPSPAPPPPLYRHTRAASISTAEISVLADQNAELMHKLEQLESESTSADHAGRRELRRLEKEISMLRQALEKTQAKSEELEAKTKGLDKGIDRAVEDAWKRRKERERKISALRRSTTTSTVGTPRRAAQAEEDWERPVRNFAPMGSGFGGPSRHFPISHEDDDLMDEMEGDSSFTSNEGESIAFPVSAPAPAAPKPDLDVVAQLLQKVKELEETNTRILQQQAETTNKLQAVQRDTEHITKVYETLAEPEFDAPAASDNHMSVDELGRSTSSRFGSLRRRVDVDRDSVRRGKGRVSAYGMFREPSEASSTSSQNADTSHTPFSWHRPSYSVGSAINSPGLAPTLNFNDDPFAELSPIGSRLTLENELQHFSSLADQGWDSDQQKAAWHLRSQSLSNLSQFSVPASPVPAANAVPMSAAEFKSDNKTPVATEFPRFDGPQRAPSTPPQTMPGTLPLVQPDLNVQPPTPSKDRRFTQRPPSPNLQIQPPLSPGLAARSPRNESIAARIRARKARWEDGRFGSMSSTTSVWGSPPRDSIPLELGLGLHPVFIPPSTLRGSASSTSLRSNASSASGIGRGPGPKVKMPMKISTVVDTLVDQFGGGLTVEDQGDETSPDSDYEDAPDYIQDTGDEAGGYEVRDDGYEEDEEDDFDDDDEQTMVNQTPQFSDGNALQLHRNGDGMMKHRNLSSSTKSFSGEGSVSSKKSSTKAVDLSKKSGGGWGSYLLELWLWLQFAVIIFVFLCAMAKRGPKAVLADAEQRTRTRKQSLHVRR